METYLESEIETELCENLFLSFIKRPQDVAEQRADPKTPASPSSGKDGRLLDVAMVASQMACASVLHQEPMLADPTRGLQLSHTHTGSLADKLHSLTERLHNLGHHAAGQGSAANHDSGKRSRAGTGHKGPYA